jgi:hypothetical protein
LDKAYQAAQLHKANIEATRKRLKELRQQFADLADKVLAEEMSLDDALSLVAQQKEEARRQEEADRQRVRVNIVAQTIRFIVKGPTEYEKAKVMAAMLRRSGRL